MLTLFVYLINIIQAYQFIGYGWPSNYIAKTIPNHSGSGSGSSGNGGGGGVTKDRCNTICLANSECWSFYYKPSALYCRIFKSGTYLLNLINTAPDTDKY